MKPLDPKHAVEPPGPRKGPLASADMLVFNPDSLSDDEVEAIRRLEGVKSVNSLAMGQVVIENQASPSRPSTRRRTGNFTLAASADTQEVWDRVAGGELAIRPELEKGLPTDRDDFLRLGSDRGRARRCTSVRSRRRSPQIDAVVNETWVDDLDMQAGNAC